MVTQPLKMNKAQFIDYHLKTIRGWKSEQVFKQRGRMTWYVRYRDILKTVDDMKNELGTSGQLDKKNEEHRIFLYRFLYDVDNGISHTPRGRLEHGDFEELIHSKQKLDYVKQVIEDPNADTGKKLNQAIKEVVGENRYVVTNKAIAACTDKVSSTVSRERFSMIFNWFLENKIIEWYPERCIFVLEDDEWFGGKVMREQEWYDENIHLMSQLNNLFEKEIQNGKTDTQFISMHVWDTWKVNYGEQWDEYEKQKYKNSRKR